MTRWASGLAAAVLACTSAKVNTTAPPRTAGPENLSFRNFRLDDVRPAGFGYSVISDRRVWEQFLRDHLPGSSKPGPERSPIDFTTHSLVILHATSGTQCFDEPVVRSVTREADTTRVFLGGLRGVCQMTDAWIEVIEVPRLRGPVRVEYPSAEYRPFWTEREIHLPLDPQDAAFAAAPDSEPAWLRSDSSFAAPSSYIPVKFVKNIVAVYFRPEATPAQRRSAVDLVHGKLVGGYRAAGIYLVWVADPGDGSGISRAAERIGALPYVTLATPDYAMQPND